jgi:hypothetical protein
MSARQSFESTARGASGVAFNFSGALASVDPEIVALFGSKLRSTAPIEFQSMAAAVIEEDYATVHRLSQTWGAVFESMGALPLVAHARQLQRFADAKDAAGIARAMGPMRLDLTNFCQALGAMLDHVSTTNP